MRIFAFILIFSLVLTASVRGEEVDLELVLAMDGSGSISEQEYILQLEGTTAAFRDPAIHTAIKSGPLGKIAVIIMLWSDAAFPKYNTGWFVLDGAQSANNFASLIRNFRLNEKHSLDIGGGGGTGIGAGVEEALKLIRQNKYTGLRNVIDVSGDGIETEFWFSKSLMIRDAKQLANSQFVTINGLPIVNSNFPNLDDYYRENVITGPGSFVVVADGFEDFKRAIKQKLLREIGSNVAFLPKANGSAQGPQ